MSEFVVKDSGERQEFDGGMVRDIEEGKIDYTLILDGPMLYRWAEHLTKGAVKYAARNWMLATIAEQERFRRSAFRHFVAWLNDERDEDHAAAVFFNINGAEYARELGESLPTFEEAVARAKAGPNSGVESLIEATLEAYLPEIVGPGHIDYPFAEDDGNFVPPSIRMKHERIRDMVMGDDEE